MKELLVKILSHLSKNALATIVATLALVTQGTGTGGIKLYDFDGGDADGVLPSGSYNVTTPVTFKFHRGADYNIENIHIKYQ